MQIFWDRLGPADWQAALGTGGAVLQQSWAYGAAAGLLGRGVVRAELVDRDGCVAVAQILVRGRWPLCLSLVSRGPVWRLGAHPADAAHALRVLARGRGAFIATPDQPLSGRGLLPLAAPRQGAVLDLTPGRAVLRAGLKGKWRNRLVRAEASGLKLRRAGAGSMDWLIRVEAQNARQRRYRALPAAFTRAWAAANPGGIRLYEAWDKGERLAGMLFLLHPPWATYHIGWTGEAGRRLNAHNLLLWHAMADLSDEGLARLDLGIADGEALPGLTRFKLGTGAAAQRAGGSVLVLPARC
jgi:hypothetical protein